MTENKEKFTLQQSMDVHKASCFDPKGVPSDNYRKAITTLNKVSQFTHQCSEELQERHDSVYEIQLSFDDSDSSSSTGNSSASAKIVQPAQPSYHIHPRKLMKFIREHVVVSCSGNDIIISIEPGYEYILDIISPSLNLDHNKISKHHAAGTLHNALTPFIKDAPVQLQLGISYVKKGGENSDDNS